MFPESGDALTGFMVGGDSLTELLDRVRGTGTGDAAARQRNIHKISARSNTKSLHFLIC